MSSWPGGGSSIGPGSSSFGGGSSIGSFRRVGGGSSSGPGSAGPGVGSSTGRRGGAGDCTVAVCNSAISRSSSGREGLNSCTRVARFGSLTCTARVPRCRHQNGEAAVTFRDGAPGRGARPNCGAAFPASVRAVGSTRRRVDATGKPVPDQSKPFSTYVNVS
ncbi:hypothetical protein CH338_15160 [Rhodoplanes elegans]|uniref:Uncharacterized protein n=1 Tax=Rhodoplanes elegans TaxID=29408 RepID=A0A327KG33_9BRAD|nr:hypothetical protein CH338_15160 [Rhodoplanes elegans]